MRGFLKIPNLHMLLKQKSPSLPRNCSWGFWQIANSALNKAKYAISSVFNSLKVLSSASDKAKSFAKIFFKKSNLYDSGISLPVFPSRNNLKLHNISITPKIVQKVITNLDSLKTSGPECIPVVISELSYIIAKLFSKCLESGIQDCWKVSLVVPVVKNVRERSAAKNYHPVSLFSVGTKVFEKLVNNRIVDHLEKCGLFLISSMALGLLGQLKIFWYVFLKEWLGLLTNLGLLKLEDLINWRLLTGFGILAFFTN